MCSTITREVPPQSSPLHLVFAVYRFQPLHVSSNTKTERQKSKISKRCPFLNKEANGCVSLFVRLLPSCAPLFTEKNLAEEVFNPSFKARHSISTRRSLPLGVITVYCILWYKPLLSVTHCTRYPIVPFHRVNCTFHCCLTSSDH